MRCAILAAELVVLQPLTVQPALLLVQPLMVRVSVPVLLELIQILLIITAQYVVFLAEPALVPPTPHVRVVSSAH